MYTTLTVIIVFAAVFLIFLVLIQNSKGGGLAAGFASGNQVMGAPKTADFLEKASWTLAAIIVALSILAVGVKVGQTNTQAQEDEQEVVEQTVDQATEAPAEAPAEEAK